MASKYKYETTLQSIIEWANSELEHVGRIVAVHDPNIQYSYALSTVNGMAHLKDALYEMVNDPNYSDKKQDLLRTHDSVVRVMKHLIKDFNIDLETIRKFNTKDVLSNLSYLENSNTNTSSPLNVKNVPNNYVPNNSKKNSLVLNTNTSMSNKNNLSNIINTSTNTSMSNKNNLTNIINTDTNTSMSNKNNLSTMNMVSGVSTPTNLGSMRNSISPPNISLNTSTPQSRSSIIENANSMSQKLRCGKRRRHKSRKHRK
jgi:hypothetical protein